MMDIVYMVVFLLVTAIVTPFIFPLISLYGVYCSKVWNWMEARLE